MNAFQQIIDWMPTLINATGVTIALSVTSVITALILSVFLALGKISKFKALRYPSTVYVFFFRGTPLLMQLFFIYYTLPNLIPSLTITSRFLAAFIAFSLNVAAYLAEIIRAAIQSIDKGQMEAAKSLGLSYTQAMMLVIIPQAYRRMIPPVANEFIMVLKDTSLVSVIALTDLTFQTKIIASNRASSLVYIPAMIIYLCLTGIFTIVFNRLEKKLSIYE
ncbi:MAG: amino acid ABC transporter permease [Clostridiales Family XIII bacterium]|jgi:polar amino acid transport system permease protein|nr:amino acid ABC transporter permease [Clostridiales Family XIII bacterium]